MSTKRQPSKQRRQSQNQKQRAALEARRQAAAAAATPAGKVGGSGTGSSRGSVLSRLRGAPSSARTPRAAVPSMSDSLRSGNQAVGQRAAMSALFAAIAAAVVGSFVFQVPIDRAGEAILSRDALVVEWSVAALDAVEADPEASASEVADSIEEWMPSGSESYGKAFWPISASVVLPVIGAGLGLRAVMRRSPAKVVNRTMYVTLLGSLLASQLLLIFLPAVIALAFAAFQVRKAEVTAAAGAGAAGVIDVDEVDGEPGAEGDLLEVDEADDGLPEEDEVLEDDEVLEVDEVADDTAEPTDDEGEPRP
jgi:hypothetical protein